MIPVKQKARLLTLLKEKIHGTIISSVSYQFSQTSIYPNDLQSKKGAAKDKIEYGLLGKFFTNENVPHSLYETICYDSNIEKEIQQNDPQKINGNQITVFAKLPKISIPTPYKNYNPDFAYLIENMNEEKTKKKLFLVVEAKGYESADKIPAAEKNKINYAKRFFKDLKQQLPPDIEIQYKTRLKSTDLSSLIDE